MTASFDILLNKFVEQYDVESDSKKQQRPNTIDRHRRAKFIIHRPSS